MPNYIIPHSSFVSFHPKFSSYPKLNSVCVCRNEFLFLCSYVLVKTNHVLPAKIWNKDSIKEERAQVLDMILPPTGCFNLRKIFALL